MKKLISFVAVLLISVAASAQGYYTEYNADKALAQKAEAWMQSGVWREGFTAAAPHSSVNAVEFYKQYQKNPDQWKALFKWLATTDLLCSHQGASSHRGFQSRG